MMNADNWSAIPNFYEPIANGSIDGFGKVPHDRAVIRALNACYKPNKLVVGEPLCTIFVARLDFSTNESMLNDVFSKFGKIKHLRLVRDIITGFSKQYAFIEYSNEEFAKKAIRRLDNTILDGKRILVTTECERTLNGWVPRRLGGGFGGKKEAGQLRFGCVDRPFKRTLIVKKHSRDVSEIEQDNVSKNLLIPHDNNKKYSIDRKIRDVSITNDNANLTDQYTINEPLQNCFDDSKNEYFNENDFSKKLSYNRDSNFKSNERDKRKIFKDYHRESSKDGKHSRSNYSRQENKRIAYNTDYKKNRYASINKKPRNILDISPNNSDNDHSSSRNRNFEDKRNRNYKKNSKYDRFRDSLQLQNRSLSRDSEHLEERSKIKERRRFNKLEDIKVETVKIENIKTED